MLDILKELYPDRYEEVSSLINNVIAKYSINPPKFGYFNEKDAILIVYPDQLNGIKKPLNVLKEFLDEIMVFTGVHILPFFPYSSDDGFAITDFRKVRDDLGSWKDIREIGKHYRLMVDLAVNHTSASHVWFKKFLEGDPYYKNFYIVDGKEGWGRVFRPRATPLFHPFQKANGEVVNVWTTFSKDQVDLNYKEPKVLASMIDTMLFYVKNNATILRLDAIAYTWKKKNTSCVNLREAKLLVKLFKSVLKQISNDIYIITETNVPHKENISYFDFGADMVYNFTLPPLLLYSVYSKDCDVLASWINSLNSTLSKGIFANFIASHDGIGLVPAKEILKESQIELIVNEAKKRGALFTYRTTPIGKEVYEVNSTLFSAIKDNAEWDYNKFLNLHSIMMSIPGVPFLYSESVLIAENDYSLYKKTKRPRSINRAHFTFDEIYSIYGERKKAIRKLFEMLFKRKFIKDLNPKKEVKATWEKPVLKIKRGKFLSLHNFSEKPVNIDVEGFDVFKIKEVSSVRLEPYGFTWLLEEIDEETLKRMSEI